MGTIKEEAMVYEAPKTKNIADLPEVSVDVQIYNDGVGTDRNGKEFKYKYLLINEEEYRVAGKVLEDLKAILKEKPNTTKIKVNSTGEGLQTRYTVIPLD